MEEATPHLYRTVMGFVVLIQIHGQKTEPSLAVPSYWTTIKAGLSHVLLMVISKVNILAPKALFGIENKPAPFRATLFFKIE